MKRLLLLLLLVAAPVWAQPPIGIVNPQLTVIQITPGAYIDGTGAVRGSITMPVGSQLLLADGTVAAPALAFASEPDTGIYRSGAGEWSVAVNHVRYLKLSGSAVDWPLGYMSFHAGDTYLYSVTAATLQLGLNAAGVTDQMFKGPDRITSDGVGGVVQWSGGRNRGAYAGGASCLATSLPAAAATPGTLANRLCADGVTGALTVYNTISVTGAAVTAGVDAGSVDASQVRTTWYKAILTGATCANAAGFKAASTNADCVIATLPAATRLVAVYANITAGFTCSGTCTGTKVMTLGKTAGGVEYLASQTVTGVVVRGIADADMGTEMTRAASIQQSALVNFASTIPVTARFVSGTGNWGTGAATYVNAGSITFYLKVETLP